MIKHPVSLKGVQKLVRGITGRDRNSGKTVLKSWNSFEDECSYIWNNARLYNEDGSTISRIAGALESHFQARLKQAKRVVEEPPQPKVKLKMSAPPSADQSSKVLRLGTTKPGNTSGVAVDSEALKRQQQLVNAGASMTGVSSWTNALFPSLHPFSFLVRCGSLTHTLDSGTGHNRMSQERGSNSSADRPSSALNGIKSEAGLSQSPHLGAATLNGDGNRSNEGHPSPAPGGPSMPPPSSNSLGSTSQTPRPFPKNFNPYNSAPSVTAHDSRWRQSGKGN